NRAFDPRGGRAERWRSGSRRWARCGARDGTRNGERVRERGGESTRGDRRGRKPAVAGCRRDMPALQIDSRGPHPVLPRVRQVARLIMQCPGCSAPMQAETLEGRYGRKIALDVCFACAVFWFDAHESLGLTPGAVLQLFTLIHERQADKRGGALDSP